MRRANKKPFGYACDMWDGLKSNLLEGDDIWKCGTSDGVFVLTIRGGEPIYKTFGKHRYFDYNHQVTLAIYD